MLSGKQLTLGQFYKAKGMDLVMFAITDKRVSGLELRSGEPNLRETVYVFGNSDGGGVATDLTGIINGVEHDKIEVTAQFVHGNSGSAVLDSDGHVVGVATYATHDVDPTCIAEINKQKEAVGILPEATASFGCPSLYFVKSN